MKILSKRETVHRGKIELNINFPELHDLGTYLIWGLHYCMITTSELISPPINSVPDILLFNVLNKIVCSSISIRCWVINYCSHFTGTNEECKTKFINILSNELYENVNCSRHDREVISITITSIDWWSSCYRKCDFSVGPFSLWPVTWPASALQWW